jgi:tetratricopeptide (TPR) repeat protein
MLTALIDLSVQLGLSPGEPDPADDPLAVACRLAGDIRQRVGELRERFDDPHNRRVRDGRLRTLADVAECLDDAATDLAIVERLDVAVPAARLAVEIRRREAGAVAELTRGLLRLAELCSAAQQHAEALAAVEEAVSASTTTGLARSLDWLVVTLGRLGRTDDARSALRRSADAHKALLPDRPQWLLAALTTTVRCRAAGLDADEVAGRGFRQLRDTDPDNRLAALADSLHALVLRFAAARSDADVVAALITAETVHEELSAGGVWYVDEDESAEAVHAPLVDVLSYLVGVLGPERSTRTAHEAVERFLGATEPDSATFLSDLAKHVERIATWLAGQGAAEEAAEVAGHAVALRRWMADGDNTYLLYDRWPRGGERADDDTPLGRALDLHAACLRDAGRPTDAQIAGEAALAVQERIVADRRLKADRDQGRGSQAADRLDSALSTLADRLAGLGRHEDALAVHRERVATLRRRVDERPDGDRLFAEMDLSRAVESVGNCLARLDRADEAVAAWHERLAIVRRHTTPGSRGDTLVRSLIDISARLSDLGRPAEALTLGAEAVDLLEARTPPEPLFGIALNNIADVLSALDRPDEALPASARAVAVARPVADANRDHRFILALALSTFAQVRAAAGRDLPAALEAAEESLRGYAVLAGELPVKYGPALERARTTATGLPAAVG